METLTASIAEIQRVATDASARAATASQVATHQTTALDGLSATSRELAALADRLRHSVSRFAVTDAVSAAAPVLASGDAARARRPNPAVPSMVEAPVTG